MILVTPAWPTQLWYPEAMIMSIQQPISLTLRRDLLKNPNGEIHLLVQYKTLKLVTWTVSGLDYKRKEFQGRFPTLSLNQEDQVLTQIMNRPGINGLAGVVKGKWIHITQILKCLTQLFQNGLPYRTMNNYRSAISAFHDHIKGKPVGEHPRICSFVAGVFDSRAPQPRYCFIWNVQTVIDFIKSEWDKMRIFPINI